MAGMRFSDRVEKRLNDKALFSPDGAMGGLFRLL